MEDEASKEPLSVSDEVRDVVVKCVDRVFTQTQTYQHSKVGQWVQQIVDSCMQSLTQLKMPRKYIAHCTIVQKGGAGMHTSTACFWDANSDGYFSHRVENKSMVCVTTVYGINL
eukprot:Sspe_Gene.81927::Locus_53218_Transcript_1_5_Confidence_0.333_Length_434::g.81927::m.81927/K10420/DYNLT; dynein light chain Tctex-type 1